MEADSKLKKTIGRGSTCRQLKNAYATMQKGKAATSLPTTVRGPSQQYPCHFIHRVNVMLVNTYWEKSILDFCSSLCKPLLRRVKFSKPNFCCYPSFLDHRNARELPSSQPSKSWFFGIFRVKSVDRREGWTGQGEIADVCNCTKEQGFPWISTQLICLLISLGPDDFIQRQQQTFPVNNFYLL